jgi:hypothetical protein
VMLYVNDGMPTGSTISWEKLHDDSYGLSGLQLVSTNCILILVLVLRRIASAQSPNESPPSESLVVKIVKITYRTNGLAFGHAGELDKSSKRLVVQKASSKSASHPEDLRHIPAKTVIEWAVAKTVP